MSDQWLTEFLRTVTGSLPPGSESLPQPIADAEQAGALIAQGDSLFPSSTFRFLIEAAKDIGRREAEEIIRGVRRETDDLRHQIAMLQVEVAQAKMLVQAATMAATSQRGLQDVITQIERAKADASTRNAMIAGGLPILGQLLTGGGR